MPAVRGRPVRAQAQTSGWNVRYRNGLKGSSVQALTDLIAERTPWLRVRYPF